ncbi:MAG: bifunctional DNA-formamidopyrimidine glycosylase/DNA-(apurinic or apyrimidinic site) lyase [Candidatus Harrisonbacteria bacterium]|nr:bifunctional DNA-formamidopyrimidine glycosylase/DNA-(apurinic or apyrimidinic site) lyase [Candidatus Harrisonbacteria bacterium]
MPELPEVQTIVNDLNKKVAGRRITGVWFDWPKMLKDPLDQQRNKISHKHAAVFEKAIKGKKILSVRRRAKNLLFYLSNNLMMLIHLKMTGHLLVGKWKVESKKIIPLEPKEVVEDPYNQYIHLIFYLDNRKMLGFSDLRKFGKIILGTKEQIENLPELKNLGPEPLDKSFKFIKFVKLIKLEKRKIKQVLMDQEVIAGIGNIYSDDILWKAKIHPLKPANKLSEKELKGIWIAIHKVLEKALKLRGTSTSDYRDTAGKEGGYTDYRLVYQREGEPCQRCKTKIRRVKIGERSAHFCPKCQKL